MKLLTIICDNSLILLSLFWKYLLVNIHDHDAKSVKKSIFWTSIYTRISYCIDSHVTKNIDCALRIRRKEQKTCFSSSSEKELLCTGILLINFMYDQMDQYSNEKKNKKQKQITSEIIKAWQWKVFVKINFVWILSVKSRGDFWNTILTTLSHSLFRTCLWCAHFDIILISSAK